MEKLIELMESRIRRNVYVRFGGEHLKTYHSNMERRWVLSLHLIKPVEPERFKKAVEKAFSYHSLLLQEEKEKIEPVADEYFFVKSDRKYFKVNFEDLLFVEGLKDYVILQLNEQRIITHMNLKAIYDVLPKSLFLRVNKSYIVNTAQIEAFDNNDIFIKTYEIAIGNSYRDIFFEEFVTRKRKRN